jgi:hypothetical protein
MVEAISLAKELNDMHGLASALSWAAGLEIAERNPAEVRQEKVDSDCLFVEAQTAKDGLRGPLPDPSLGLPNSSRGDNGGAG